MNDCTRTSTSAMGDVFRYIKVAYQQNSGKNLCGHKVACAKTFFFFFINFFIFGYCATLKHMAHLTTACGLSICYTKDNFPSRTYVTTSTNIYYPYH